MYSAYICGLLNRSPAFYMHQHTLSYLPPLVTFTFGISLVSHAPSSLDWRGQMLAALPAAEARRGSAPWLPLCFCYCLSRSFHFSSFISVNVQAQSQSRKRALAQVHIDACTHKTSRLCRSLGHNSCFSSVMQLWAIPFWPDTSKKSQ